ncbi:hypothetical protein ABIB25_002115 [Nakamurella sp. UYEF19]|uniref:THUMP-like domain-containing protein n=1 Tax=Nakamurella sp. UYEF19 TaxID=1756392 RepID=UPI003395A364
MSSGYRFSAEDLDFLTSSVGDDLLAAAQARPLTDSSLLADLTGLRRSVGSRAQAVAETVRLRRKAVPKLGEQAARWLFTDEALQQATPWPVAQHRAARLAGHGVHDLTCSVGADLAALVPVCEPAIGSDLDPVRARMARHNLASLGVPAPVLVADALTVVSRGLLPYADPARREAGRRITSVDTLPSVADLDHVHSARLPVLRLPPGIDYEALGRPGEVEIVSLDGGAREAVLWPPELGVTSRRATVLSSTGAGFEVTSDDPDEVAKTVQPEHLVGEWLVDPDAAVVRAHLVRHYGCRHGLRQLDPHLAYLAGPRPAGVRAFRVLDSAAYSVATVTGWIRRDGTGTLEIKQRGTSVVPDELRKRMRPAMTKDTTVAHTLVVARIGDRPWAFWCRASESAP